MKRTLTFAALMAIGTATLAPLPASAGTDVRLVIDTAPPPLRYEAVPEPRYGYVWSPGHWEWRHHRHEWVNGFWIRERTGYVYEPATWVQIDGRWQWSEPRWIDRRHASHGYRDRDRDGVPDRYDHDRDGDGVPNRYDSHPNNPYRR